MTEDSRELRLPEELCRAAQERYGARYGGLEPFLEFVLRQLLRDDAARMDEAEQKIIEERLKDLGYI
ncbi:MAG TPA: hypothetical protein VLV49_13355 [Terriglobales bacterium]|nr:hypothetical protein [Terriglobales bacterium]